MAPKGLKMAPTESEDGFSSGVYRLLRWLQHHKNLRWLCGERKIRELYVKESATSVQ